MSSYFWDLFIHVISIGLGINQEFLLSRLGLSGRYLYFLIAGNYRRALSSPPDVHFTLDDTSSDGADVTPTGATFTPGLAGNAADLTGSTDYIEIGTWAQIWDFWSVGRNLKIREVCRWIKGKRYFFGVFF